ncbi:hypothetical protein [Oceanivirga salmonicida]|uniref:hypothetical protein n=1 Tax=Oceanivirga salmonicida TaxID=1769291 RepID=UPI0008308CDA|nr:hypothetical protein [Oceanivirga salmonicida]
MKKYMLNFLLLSAIVSAKDNVDWKIGTDFSVSYGLEGLDLNVDKYRTIKMLLPRNALENEVIPKNLNKFLDALKFENENSGIYYNYVINKPLYKKEPEDIKSVLLRGIVFDMTFLNLEVDIKNIGTKIGTKIKSTPTRYGSDNKLAKVDKFLIYSDTETKHLDMHNKIFIRATDKNVLGLEKYFYGDLKPGASFEFESIGKVRPYLKLPVIPELSYSLNLSNKNKNFSLAPGILYKIIDNENEKLEISANYHVSNYSGDIFDKDEFEKDLVSLTPGYDKVDYFKNWEKSNSNNVELGYLDGKNGRIRSIGLPTGSLYGDNVMKIITQEALKAIVAGLKKEGLDGEINDILNRIRNKDKDFDYEHIKKILKNIDKYKGFTNNFKDKEKALIFFEDAIKNIAKELGLKPNQDISSFDLLNYVPDNFLKYLLTKKDNENVAKMLRTVNFSDPKYLYKPNGKVTIVDDLQYLFPDEYIKPLYKALPAKFIVDDVNKIISPILEEINPVKDRILHHVNKIDEYNRKLENCSSINVFCKGKYAGKLAVATAKLVNNANDIVGDLAKITRKYRPKVEEIFNKTEKIIDNLSSEEYGNLEKAKELKKSIHEALTLFDDVEKLSKNNYKLWKVKTLIKTFKHVKGNVLPKINKFKDVEGNYINPALDFVKPILGKLVDNIDDMINAPHKIDNFLIFSGLNTYKVERDIKKDEYLSNILKDTKNFKDTPVGNGFNANINYKNKKYNLETNFNIDDTFTKHTNKFSVISKVKYSPKLFDLETNVSLIDKQINHPKIVYNKLSIDTELGLKFKIYNRKKNFLFKPGISYSGEYGYITYIKGGTPVTVFKRDKKNMLIKRENAPLTSDSTFNSIKAGESVDISKYSKHLFKEKFEKYFETEEKNGQSRWVGSSHYIVPSIDLIYNPIKNIELKYNLIVPIKLNSYRFDGILIKNTFGLAYKF